MSEFKQLNSYGNLLNLYNINNIEQLITSDLFNYNFDTTTFNTALNKFVKSHSVNVDNKSILNEYIIHQYLSDFKLFWDYIEQNNKFNVLVSTDLKYDSISAVEKANNLNDKINLYYNLKYQYCKLIMEYSRFKGTKLYLEFIYQLFYQLSLPTWNLQPNITYNYINDNNHYYDNDYILQDIYKPNIIESTIKTCVYIVSGGLTKQIYEIYIKPLTHPTGWVCDYSSTAEYIDNSYNIVDNHLYNYDSYVDYSGCNITKNNTVVENLSLIELNDLLRPNEINISIMQYNN